MTRKDYIRIAAALYRDSAHLADYARMGYTPAEIHSFLCYSVMDALGQENPLFDRAKFAKACGVQS